MMSASGHWDDLLPRLLSAFALAGIALLEVWLGGTFFNVFVALVVSVMVWELGRMFEAPSPVLVAAGAGLILLLAAEMQWPWLVGIATLAVLLMPLTPRMRLGVGAALLAILVAGYGVTFLRAEHGFIWMIWFALVVVVTDIGGYFAGRMLGGPKFWPSLSPKKTWSGTIAGWGAAAVISIPFVALAGSGWALVVIAAAMALAGQFGDIAESALKRKAKVKDSGGLLPGHGGLLDRFDSMVGASLFLLVLMKFTEFP